MSSFFRRPGDSDSDTNSESSSSSDSDSRDEANESIDRSLAPQEEGNSTTANLSKTESVSSTASFANDNSSQDERNISSVDQIRNMMLVALLEDFYKSQAAQLLNSGQPGSQYNKDSAEVQPLATRLFAEGSRALALNGVIQPLTVNVDSQNTRRQYLMGLGNLGLSAIKEQDLQIESSPQQQRLPPATTSTQLVVRRPSYNPSEIPNMFPNVMQNLMTHTQNLSINAPQSDLQLSTFASHRSHYESSFRELCLLGRGGFGRVYHAYNLFDKKEYAVKKIALSPRMSHRYREAGHIELEGVLREVQALASLDHNNVVRYHATWIEEPCAPPVPLFDALRMTPFQPRRKLLADHAASKVANVSRPPVAEQSDGIVFELDNTSGDINDDQRLEPQPNLWSQHPSMSEQPSLRESEIFTDGQARSPRDIETSMDRSVYVLHVQMSMYPGTLAQYLAPKTTTLTTGPSTMMKRHCFHLVPALRILLGILCGLQYIHARGLIHRDIKPSNIFLSGIPDNDPLPLTRGRTGVESCRGCDLETIRHLNPRIGDFGLVTQLAQADAFPVLGRPSESDRVVGTEYYRPPTDNDSHGKRTVGVIDEKVDVFALGVVMVELLWPCSTSSERLQVLRDLQQGKPPVDLAKRVDLEGHGFETGRLVEECIRAMVEPRAAQRCDCADVDLQLRDLLARCQPDEDPSILHGQVIRPRKESALRRSTSSNVVSHVAKML